MERALSDTSIDESLENKFKEQIREIVLRISGKHACRIFLYGSRARGQPKRWSDFDIGVRGLPAKAFRSLRSSILEAAEESLVPHAVDVVNFDEADETFVQEAEKAIEIWKDA